MQENLLELWISKCKMISHKISKMNLSFPLVMSEKYILPITVKQNLNKLCHSKQWLLSLTLSQYPNMLIITCQKINQRKKKHEKRRVVNKSVTHNTCHGLVQYVNLPLLTQFNHKVTIVLWCENHGYSWIET